MDKLILKENDVMVVSKENRALSTKQINALNVKTPVQYMHKRTGRGEQVWDYITGAYVRKQLNRILGHDWDFEIKTSLAEAFEVAKITKSVVVIGRLTIRTNGRTIVKEQVGRSDVKFLKSNPSQPVDFGNDLKSAATDCLKKCASTLGIAADVYDKQEYREIELQEEKAIEDKRTKDANEKVDQLLEGVK